MEQIFLIFELTMKKGFLSWWWFFLTTGILLPLIYWGITENAVGPYSILYNSFVTGLNPFASIIQSLAVAAIISFPFLLLPAGSKPRAYKHLYFACGMLVMIFFITGFIFFKRDIPVSGIPRRYIGLKADLADMNTAPKAYAVTYLALILALFLFFFIRNFPRQKKLNDS